MSTKHTPGPWFCSEHRFKEYGDLDLCSHTVTAGREDDPCLHLATIISDCVVESQANARLIAAAPELLDALEEVMDEISGRIELEAGTRFRVRAAIRKALGEEK